MTTNAESMSAAQVMHEMVAAFDSGDLSRVAELVDPGYIDHQGLGPESRPMIGVEGFRTVVETARRGYSELSVTIADLIEAPDRVAARLLWKGRRPSGEEAEREGLDIIRVQNGRAVEHWGGSS